MYRRLVVPAVCSAASYGVWQLYCTSWYRLHWRWTYSFCEEFPLFIILDPLQWVIVPMIFYAVYMCGARGGGRRECFLVGLAPLAVSALLLCVSLARLAVRGGREMSVAWVALHFHDPVRSLGMSLAALWLYFFAAGRLPARQRAGVSEQPPEGPSA